MAKVGQAYIKDDTVVEQIKVTLDFALPLPIAVPFRRTVEGGIGAFPLALRQLRTPDRLG